MTTLMGRKAKYRDKIRTISIRLTQVGIDALASGRGRLGLSSADYLETLVRRDNGVEDAQPSTSGETT